MSSPPHRRGKAYHDLADACRQRGDVAGAAVAESLAFAFTMIVAAHGRFSDPKPRFALQGFATDRPVDLGQTLRPEIWDRWRSAKRATRNPAVRARLADLFWEHRKDHAAAREAADSYLEHADAWLGCPEDRSGLCAADALVRSLEISLQINDAGRTQRALDASLDSIRRLVSGGRPRPAWELMKELLGCKKVKAALPFDELQALVEHAIVRELDADPTSLWETNWLWVLVQLGHARGDAALARAAMLRIAEAHERSADFWTERGGHLQATTEYQDAVEAYRRAGHCSDRVRATLGKLESGVRRSREQMKLVEASVKIPREDMERWKAEVLAGYDRHGLSVLASAGYALPNAGEVRQSVAAQQEEFPLASLFPSATFENGRVVGRANTAEEHAAVEVRQQLVMHLQMRAATLASWVFERIRERGGTMRDEVLKYISESPVIMEERRELLVVGLERYDAGDYVSSVHIVVFQIEGIVRDFAGLNGLPTTRDENGITQARPLPDLLRDEELTRVLGDDLTQALSVLLVEQGGPNVRNAVAHGLAGPGVFVKPTADLLVVLLLQLAGFRRSPTTDGGPTK